MILNWSYYDRELFFVFLLQFQENALLHLWSQLPTSPTSRDSRHITSSDGDMITLDQKQSCLPGGEFGSLVARVNYCSQCHAQLLSGLLLYNWHGGRLQNSKRHNSWLQKKKNPIQECQILLVARSNRPIFLV